MRNEGNILVPALKVKTILHITHFKGNTILDESKVYNRKFTTLGAQAIANMFMGVGSLSNFNYHDCGTGSAIETKSDTDLQSSIGTGRVLGTQSLYSPLIYQTEITYTYAAEYTITEHGIFNSATAGVLLDRTVFTGRHVRSGEGLRFVFQLEFAGED